MTDKELATTDSSMGALNALIMNGDMSKLTPQQKLAYYHQVCEKVGLNPYTRPFDYMVLNGKQVLYANKGCAEQIRNIKGISVTSMKQEQVDDIIVITVEGKDKDGRVDTEMGFARTGNGDSKLKGDHLGNAILKAMTKAKRRLTLSMAGLGMLDETEVDSIPGVQKMVDITPQVDSDGVVMEYITEEQLANLNEWLTATESNIPKFLIYMGVKSLPEVTQDKYEIGLNALKQKIKQNEGA